VVGHAEPPLYGVAWDEPSGHHWLLLEFVQGRTLRQSPIEDWIAAAGWLGRLHATIAGREAELTRPGLLIDYNEAYFRGMAERALRAVGSRSGSLQRRLAAAMDGYGAMIERFREPADARARVVPAQEHPRRHIGHARAHLPGRLGARRRRPSALRPGVHGQ
jgi:hypothetical protein